MLHVFAFCSDYLFSYPAPVMARFSLAQATALKATREAGRRGGDSIARRHVFNYQN
jgi:hypothetical protein